MNDIWDKIYGQEKVKKILQELIKTKRVPHAFIFSGKDGVGKFNTALQFTKMMYSNSNYDKDHSIYNKLNSLQEPYIKLIFPLPRGKGETAEDSATDKLSKDQIELIQEQIHFKIKNPFHNIDLDKANTIKINSIREIKKFIVTEYSEIPFRFIFIVNADLMNAQAQNALLKNLEEPPEGIYFVLLTNNKEKLLLTIQSRCWNIEFEPLNNYDVENLLINFYNIDTKQANKVSKFAEGSLQNAIKLLDTDIEKTLENIISILRYALAHRYYSAYESLKKIINEKNSDQLKQTIRLIKVWLNDVIKNQYSINKYYFSDYSTTLEKFNEKFRNIDLKKVYNRLDVLEDGIEKNLNLNVLTLNLIFEISSISLRK